MSADFSDIVVASAIGSSIGATNVGDIRREGATQRAKNIEDNFGIKPTDLEEYRSQHGGSGFLKALGWIAVGAVAGALFIGTAGMAAVGYGALAGIVAGMFSMANQNSKVMSGYSNYLDDVATQGRAAREHGKGVEYDNGAGKHTAYAADIAAERQKPVIIIR